MSSCPSCSFELNSPVTFSPCKHKCCSNCLMNVIFHKYYHLFQEGDQVEIPCYICQKGSITLGFDEITQMISQQSPNYHLFCKVHGIPAGQYCETCSKYLCSACIQEHTEQKLNHKIQKISKNYFAGMKKENVKLPFKSKTAEEYSQNLNSFLRNFEKKINEYKGEISKKIDEMVSELNQYKDNFSGKMDKIMEREKKVCSLFIQFNEKFYSDIEVSSEKRDYISLKNICDSVDRQFEAEELIHKNLVNEDLEGLKEQIDSYLSSMKEVHVRYFFPIAPRAYTNPTTLLGHTDKINTCCLLKGGDIASGGRDSVIRIWTKDSGYKNEKNLENPDAKGDSGWLSYLMVLNDGNLLSGYYDGTVKIWDPNNNWSCIHTLPGHTTWVSSGFQFQNGILITSSFDNKIIVRSQAKKYQQIYKMKEHTFGVFALAKLKDYYFASGSGDKTIKIWNKELSVVTTLKGHGSTVKCLQYLAKTDQLASGSNDKTIKIWDYLEGECLMTIKAHNDGVSCLGVLYDGRLVSGAEDNLIKIFDNGNNFNCTHIFKGHSNVINAIAIMDETRLITASGDKRINIWCENRNIIEP